MTTPENEMMHIDTGIYLSVKPRKCTGCMSCLLFCSFVHEGLLQPSAARVLIDEKPAGGFTIRICRQCTVLFCANACQVNAISRSQSTGVIFIDYKVCNGCGECVEACPFGAVTVNQDRQLALICDLCNGEPECAKVCAAQAIEVTKRRSRKLKAKES